MLPQHEPLDPGQWRQAWEQAAGRLGRVRVIVCPGQPRDPGPFTGVTPVPFAMLSLAGRIAVRTADGGRFALLAGEACLWAPGTWVACWHAECQRYLRATIDHDHVFAALKDHERRRRGGRLVDLYGVAVPGLLDPALRGLLAGLAGAAWDPPAARAAGGLLFWAVHAHLGSPPAPDAFGRLRAIAAREPPPDRAVAARELGVAAETVSRLCRRLGGCTWLELIDAARLQRAEVALRGGGTLDTVATACGFASAGHLIRRFRHRHGLTPDAWRRGLSRVAPRPD